MLKRKNLIGMEGVLAEEIEVILQTADSFKEILKRDIKKVPTLRGKSVINMFYESSTRTRTSFELAGKYMSADTINFAKATSSVNKGETLLDTAKTLEMMRADVVIIRHPIPGSAQMLAKHIDSCVINAGDGNHEHPTQALLDIFSIKEKKNQIKGLKIALIGDIQHSRVARSNIFALTELGADVCVSGPSTLIPPYIEELGVKVYNKVEDALEGADVVNVLRIQLERQKKGLFPSLREYAFLYGINHERLKLAKEDALVLHPGPMNRGIEITTEIADGPWSVIDEQVTNGVAIRMALLYLLLGGDANGHIN